MGSLKFHNIASGVVIMQSFSLEDQCHELHNMGYHLLHCSLKARACIKGSGFWIPDGLRSNTKDKTFEAHCNNGDDDSIHKESYHATAPDEYSTTRATVLILESPTPTT